MCESSHIKQFHTFFLFMTNHINKFYTYLQRAQNWSKMVSNSAHILWKFDLVIFIKVALVSGAILMKLVKKRVCINFFTRSISHIENMYKICLCVKFHTCKSIFYVWNFTRKKSYKYAKWLQHGPYLIQTWFYVDSSWGSRPLLGATLVAGVLPFHPFKKQCFSLIFRELYCFGGFEIRIIWAVCIEFVYVRNFKH